MNITEQLRQAADCAPLWRSIFEAAADEIERLQEDSNKIRGRMHDQWINQNKVKADAVRDAAKKLQAFNESKGHDNVSAFEIRFFELYAEMIGRGDV